MGTVKVLYRSLGHHCGNKSKPYLSRLFDCCKFTHPLSSENSKFHQWQYQSRRNLILQSASESVKLHRLSIPDSGIVEVKLDRPEAKNAIGKDMLRGLWQSFESIQKDASARVVMICSSLPKVFCAGADLKERRTMNPSEVRSFVNSLRSTFSFLEALHIPTIAVIEGAALGGGLEMALSCDLRICGEDSVLGLPETGLAIIPGWSCTMPAPNQLNITL